jgi:AcrR family transcriptional regulator
MISTTDVRTRILQAAQSEFAAYGLAGARIDRMARTAAASKERLYAHFSDKSALFQAVLDARVTEFHDAVVLDPEDVPAFVGDVFDHTHEHPDILRMLTWARLEGFDYALPGLASTPDDMLESLREAQRRGTVDSAWKPEELVPLLFGIASAWAQSPVAALKQATPGSLAAHRAAAVEAGRRMVSSRA